MEGQFKPWSLLDLSKRGELPSQQASVRKATMHEQEEQRNQKPPEALQRDGAEVLRVSSAWVNHIAEIE